MATTKEVIEKLDRIYTLLGEMQKENASRDAEIKRVADVADSARESIKGNGKTGLEQRMILQEDREGKRDRREWFFVSVLTAETIALVFTVLAR